MAVYTAINDAGSFFNTKLYTGNGSTDTAITGVGFQPDFIWFKNRDTTDFHNCYDSVRGVQKVLVPNGTDVEYTDDETLLAFGADGFTIGLRSNVNLNTATYVAWSWKAGTTSVPSGGDLTPSAVSLNATSGFSIIVYTGTGDTSNTIAHGLATVPKFMFFKNRDAAMDWVTYNAPLGNTDYMILNNTDARATSTTRWNDTTPTSTLLTIGNTDKLNSDTVDYIGYVFADVQGYSKFGSYVGNGQADGPFIYTGFRPSFLMIKGATTSGGVWQMYDHLRIGYNIENHFMEADAVTVEADDDNLDLLSNGFKVRRVTSSMNTSGDLYLYMAFARAPLVNSSGVPCNAR